MSDAPENKIVAISRQQGSGGSYIGRAVAERLGFRYFDRELLRAAAEFLREHEQSSQPGRPRADSWFDRLASYFTVGSLDTGYVPPSPTVLYEGEVVEIENRLIREIADDHTAVIVGRGAAQILRGHRGVTTVFVHASEPWRVERVQQVYKTATHAQALRMVQQSDRERTRFIRRLAEIEWADTRGYDLAINSMALGDAAVELIVGRVTGTSTTIGV
jgi:cytidylate kinase